MWCTVLRKEAPIPDVFCLGESCFPCRSVTGLSIDFQMMNLLGFVCYTVYNTALYFSPVVRTQYMAAHSANIPVGLNDVVFSVHAMLITGTLLIVLHTPV